jgi:hypothetical protein
LAHHCNEHGRNNYFYPRLSNFVIAVSFFRSIAHIEWGKVQSAGSQKYCNPSSLGRPAQGLLRVRIGSLTMSAARPL